MANENNKQDKTGINQQAVDPAKNKQSQTDKSKTDAPAEDQPTVEITDAATHEAQSKMQDSHMGFTAKPEVRLEATESTDEKTKEEEDK